MSDYQNMVLKKVRQGDWDRALRQISDHNRKRVEVVPGLEIINNRSTRDRLRGKYLKLVPNGTKIKECKRLFYEFMDRMEQKDIPF